MGAVLEVRRLPLANGDLGLRPIKRATPPDSSSDAPCHLVGHLGRAKSEAALDLFAPQLDQLTVYTSQ